MKRFFAWFFKPMVSPTELLIVVTSIDILVDVIGLWALLIAFLLVYVSTTITDVYFKWKVKR